MKENFVIRILFFLITATTTVLFSTNSYALPVFARQMGVECNACHAGTYPLLTPFGRQFKESAYTMIGSETTVEGSDSNGKLSLPSVLNLGIFATTSYTKSNGTTGKTVDHSTNSDTSGGSITLPDEVTLFVGGRAGEHMGYIGEVHFTDLNNGTGTMGGGKLPIQFEVGPGRVMFVPFSTSGQGASYGFEVLNTGANAVHTIMEDNAIVYSAAQYLGTGGDAGGFTLGYIHEIGYITFTKWDPNHNVAGQANPTSDYFRLVATPDLINGWDTDVGFQLWSGHSVQLGDNAGISNDGTQQFSAHNLDVATKAWVVDAQLQGSIGVRLLGVWASYGHAAASDCSDGGTVNFFNPGCTTTKTFNIGTMYEVLPHLLFLDAGYRNAKRAAGDSLWTTNDAIAGVGYDGTNDGSNGGTAGALASIANPNRNSGSDNAVTVGAIIKPTQNSKIELTYGHEANAKKIDTDNTVATNLLIVMCSVDF